MDALEFLRTIYLGDRGLESIYIDGINERVVLSIDLISRIRSATGEWSYYADEDIEHGQIVFTGAKHIYFDPPGIIPNDYIELRSAEFLPADNTYTPERCFRVQFSVASSIDAKRGQDIIGGFITIIASGVHLEDPLNSGTPIVQ
jgi:hypothetical protein